MKSIRAVCPTCGEDVQLPERYKIGQIVRCNCCDAELEILSANPPVLDWPYILDHGTYHDEGDPQDIWNMRN